MMETKTLQQEKTHLQNTLQKVADAKRVLEKSLESLGQSNLGKLKEMRDDPITSGDDFLMFVQQLHEANESFNVKDKVQRLDELEYTSAEPYFARIDLKDPLEAADAAEQLYIGKFGYTEDKPIIIDWRAKIASIYYRYRFPQKNVQYQTHEAAYTKDLLLKRTFEIDKGELLKFYNNDIQFDEDTHIAEKIDQRTGGVLEDIVETIQEGQLDIIESDPRKVCIVQGSVGSGKSTVAIHKLSHIFFNFSDIIKPERSILVAKSGILVSYLATLFPKLGIFDINYKTLRELIINVVFREEMNVKFDLDAEESLGSFDLNQIKKLDKSLDAVHNEYEQLITKTLEKENYSSFSSFVYTSDQPISENFADLITDLEEELDFQKTKLKDNPNSIKVWIWKENILTIKKMIKDVRKIKEKLSDETHKKICTEWGINIKESLSYTQILIYLYIYEHLFGFNKSIKYQYCVVDEGQDLSVLEYLVLGVLVQNGRFCILGDLNQSYQKEGLTTWEVIKEVIKEAKEAETFTLTTNYRSTRQIIEFANSVLRPYTQDYLPESINRQGEEPKIIKTPMINDLFNAFAQQLAFDLKNLDKSIGVVVYDETMREHVEKITDKVIADAKIPEQAYIKLDSKKRISYIPRGVYLADFSDCKGLEFSKVYIVGLNLDTVQGFLSAKKAFVAVTRAMNEVVVLGLN